MDKLKQKRWNRTSKAAKFLRKGLQSGEIDPNDTPKNIKETYPIFSEYSDTAFRAAWNRMKAELGIHVHKGDESNKSMLGYNDNSDGKYSPGVFSFVFVSNHFFLFS